VRVREDRHILIVDDDGDARGALAELLRSRGVEVVEAADGAEALVLAEARRPAAVLTDLDMPTMDGRGLLARLRAHPGLSSTPVLVVSASTEWVPAADHQLTKPCRWSEVWSALRDLLRPGREQPVPA
jgi:CheY-like chemotaxis protein